MQKRTGVAVLISLVLLPISIRAFAEDKAPEHLDGLMANPLAAIATRWKCTPTKMYLCGSDGCQTADPSVSPTRTAVIAK